MQFLGHFLFKLLILTLRFVPFFIIYVLADFLSFILFYFIKYRKDIVLYNLKNAFPEKSDFEIKQITKKFYKNLSDITLESIKGFSMSKKELLKRYKVLNPELINNYLPERSSFIGIGSHYCNWEWGVLSFSLQFPQQTIGFYKPLTNKYTNNYLLKTRAAWGMYLESIKGTADVFAKNSDTPTIFFMISDQSPSNLKKSIWIDFLNQETPFLHGAEFYARKMNYPVIYGDVQRVKRGFYTIYLSIIESQPKETVESEITHKLAKKLESIIIEKPENWLWSHKRWKHKRRND